MNEEQLASYLRAMQLRHPELRFVKKEGDTLSHLIHVLLIGVTLGGQRSYLSDYVTTLGSTIFLPAKWDNCSVVHRYVVLRHEEVHLHQFRRWGFSVMALLYLLPIFPLGLAWGRARLEWEAYAETLRATAETAGLPAARAPRLRQHIVRQFTSASYGWMWPFPRQVNRWIDEELARMESGEHAEHTPCSRDIYPS